MNAEEFVRVYNEVRNGANQLYHHPLVRKFCYSDGVRDLLQTGAYWVMDILASELPKQFKNHEDESNTCIVEVHVADERARITAEFEDGKVAWTKIINYTDLPAGSWKFYVCDEGDRFVTILLSEY